jgi:hypothetical protein
MRYCCFIASGLGFAILIYHGTTPSVTPLYPTTPEDLGFQGLQNEFVNIHLPHKKPTGKELSEEQKQQNKEFSSHIKSV